MDLVSSMSGELAFLLGYISMVGPTPIFPTFFLIKILSGPYKNFPNLSYHHFSNKIRSIIAPFLSIVSNSLSAIPLGYMNQWSSPHVYGGKVADFGPAYYLVRQVYLFPLR